MKAIGLSLSMAVSAALLSACSSIGNSNNQTTLAPSDYTLEKVVFFSRHGIRAPLIGYGSALAEATPQTWPTWTTEGGHLTPKGAQLEGIFAEYLGHWLDVAGLIKQGECRPEAVLVYTNSLPRTIATGEQFAQKAFADCGIDVRHLEAVGKMDNTFNPIVRSTVDAAFEEQLRRSIDESLGAEGFAGLNQRLANSYAALEKVLNYQNSIACKEKNSCQIEGAIF